jgi:hypothetical protein
MNLLNIFKKKEKKIENKIEEKEKETLETKNFPSCASCHSYIESWEKIKSFNREKYHVKCFRKLRKGAIKSVLG